MIPGNRLCVCGHIKSEHWFELPCHADYPASECRADQCDCSCYLDQLRWDYIKIDLSEWWRDFKYSLRNADIKNYLSTIIWCGWCGETHRFGNMDNVICPNTCESLQSPKAWQTNGVRSSDEKQDIFIAWDNLAKCKGTFKQKVITEKKVWTMMFNNAYDKHRNGQEKTKGCKDCQKNELHKPDFEKMYLTAGWRTEDVSVLAIDAFEELAKARKLEDTLDKLATLLRCSPPEIDVKINKLLKNISDLEKQIASYPPKPEEPLQK